MATMTVKGKAMKSVDVDWNEVYYTNCPLISASNVDQELGWTKEEFKKIGVSVHLPAFQRARTTGTRTTSTTSTTSSASAACFPPIHVQADIRRTRLLGCDPRAPRGRRDDRAPRDPIYRMKDLKGKKIGLSKSLNTSRTTGGASRSIRASS